MTNSLRFKSSHHLRLIVLGLLFIFLILVGIFLIPVNNHSSSITGDELRMNMRHWRETNIDDYRMRVENRGYGPFVTICYAAELQVRNNRIVFIQVDDTNDDWWTERCADSTFQDLTTEGLFHLAQEYSEISPLQLSQMEVQFDEHYGYISYLRIIADRVMFLTNRDDLIPASFEITITEFQPLNEEYDLGS